MVEIAFLFGLLGSVHCLGMCGPIAFLLPLEHQKPWKKATQIILYHLGRILAYSCIGLVFGILGQQISLFGFQQYLSIATGVLMILFVLLPHTKFRSFSGLKIVTRIISKLQFKLSALLRQNNNSNLLVVGILNGFLPCGFVYLAVFGSLANSQNLLNSVLFMVFFGLGTIPIMTTAVYAFQLFSKKTQQLIRNQFPVLVIVLAGLFILRGLGLEIPYLSPAPIEMISNDINCH